MSTKIPRAMSALAGLALLVGLAPGAAAGGRPDHAADSAVQADGRVQDTPSWARHLEKQGWELAWGDEFDGGGIDPAIWDHEVNCWGGGNNERQCYTDRAENSFVDDGLLHIVAHEESFTGPALQDDHPDYPGGERTQDYTSARLRTKGLQDFTYGRIEVRAKVPGGQGMWPAIWMLPTDWVYGDWPSSGEIDIFEAVNLPTGDFVGWGPWIHGTLHYGLPWPQWENHGASRLMDESPADDFHTYSLEWEPDAIRWYVDGEHWQTQTSDGWYNWIWGGQDTGFEVANPRAPFDQDFHLLLNLAVGGDWPGAPDSDWDGSREMLVDYVRVYECLDGPGRCGTVDHSLKVNTDAGAPGTNDYVLFDGGVETLDFEVDGVGGVSNTPVPGQFAFPGVTVDSTPGPDGWEVGFSQTGDLGWGAFVGNVFLTAEDMSGVEGVLNGLRLAGGSGWTINGELSFDLTVDSIDPDTDLFVKMDSGYPSVGFVEIDPPAAGESAHVAVKIADLLANWNPWESPLDPSNIANLFVLESTGPADLVIDDIELSCAYNTEPEDWQSDKTCELAPRVPVEPLHRIFIDDVTITDADTGLPAAGFVNGDFSSGLDAWSTFTGSGGDADFAVEDGAARIDVFAQGSETWSIQFFESFTLEPGTYDVSYRARSTEPRVIETTFETDGFYRALDTAPALTTEWQTFTGTFEWGSTATGSMKFLVGREP